MSEIVKFELESGGHVFVEIPSDQDGRSPVPHSMPTGPSRAGAQGGPEEASALDKSLTVAGETFEKAIERVKPAAAAVVQAFRELNEPDEIGLELGIQLSKKAGGFVLTGEASATFKLSLKWTRSKEKG